MSLQSIERRYIKSHKKEIFRLENNHCYQHMIGMFILSDLYQVETMTVNLNTFDYSEDVQTFRSFEDANTYYQSNLDDTPLFN